MEAAGLEAAGLCTAEDELALLEEARADADADATELLSLALDEGAAEELTCAEDATLVVGFQLASAPPNGLAQPGVKMALFAGFTEFFTAYLSRKV